MFKLYIDILLIITVIILVSFIVFGRSWRVLSSKIFFLISGLLLILSGILLFLTIKNFNNKPTAVEKNQVKQVEAKSSYIHKKTLIVGTSASLYPWNFKGKNGKLRGFQVDLIKKAAILMGKKVVFKVMPYKQLYQALKEGKIDIISDITPFKFYPLENKVEENIDNNTHSYTFSINYANIPVVFFGRNKYLIKNSHNNIKKLESLIKDQKISVQVYTPFYSYVKSFANAQNIVSTKTGNDTINKVVDGKCSVGIIDYYSIKSYLLTHKHSKIYIYKPFIINKEDISPLKLSFALNNEDPELKKQFDIALLVLKRKGKISTLSVKYFNNDITL